MGKRLEVILLVIYICLTVMGIIYMFNDDFFYFVNDVFNELIRTFVDSWWMMPYGGS